MTRRPLSDAVGGHLLKSLQVRLTGEEVVHPHDHEITTVGSMVPLTTCCLPGVVVMMDHEPNRSRLRMDVRAGNAGLMFHSHMDDEVGATMQGPLGVANGHWLHTGLATFRLVAEKRTLATSVRGGNRTLVTQPRHAAKPWVSDYS